jgi:two-component system, NtrC family, sensor histidine kinase KinB
MAIHMCAEEAAGPLTREQAALMAGARHDCVRLQSIIDDILDLARLQKGSIQIHARPIDATTLLRQAASVVAASARAVGLEVVVEGASDPLPVLADPERIEIVLANLLGNAVRHAPTRGRLVARVERVDAWGRFEVRDSGPGIPAQYRDRIFERFFQVPGPRRGGVGLGLYIAREIVQAHGGAIGLESEEGHGSTFWFTLPMATSSTG